MLIQIRHPIVPDWDVRQKRQRPRIPGSYDESVYLFDRGSIDEVDCLARDVRDRWLLQDIWMLECVVAEVQVWSMAFDDGDDGVFRYTKQVDGYISAGAVDINTFDRHWFSCLYSLTQKLQSRQHAIVQLSAKSQRPRKHADLLFPDKYPSPYKPLYE